MYTTDQLVAAVWRRRLTFLLAFVCVLGAVAAITYKLPKAYSTNAYLIVNLKGANASDYAAQQASQVDTQTTAELLQTRNTADAVASQLPYQATGKQVQGRVGISPVSNTQLVLITATESSPLRAQELANTYASVFEQRTAPTIGFASVTLGDPAPLITDPSSPRTHLYLLVGAILALLVGIGAAVLRDRFDTRVRIENFETEAYGLPILARVPQVRMARGRLRRTEHQGFTVIEALNSVFAQLAFVNHGERPRSIAVVSAGEQEGKTTVCAALGHAAEDRLRSRVLLVDADLRRPGLSTLMDVSNPDDEGLSSYLVDDLRSTDFSTLIAVTEGSRISVVPAGPIPPNPTSLLGLPRFSQFAARAAREFAFVVFDTAPVRAGADASLVATAVDGAILVVDARNSSAPSVRWSIAQLRRANVNVLGVILNRVGSSGDLAYYHYGSDRGRRGGRGRNGKRDPAGVRKPQAVGGADPATTVSAD